MPRAATVLTLCALIALAGSLRIWRLDAVPPGLFGDEAADGLVAREILAGDRRPIYVEEPEATKWGSREPLFHYLMAGVFAVGGASTTTLRLTSALLGIAAVPLLYLLCRRLFTVRVALLAAALLAVSRWDITISRLGVRAVLAPLWAVLVALAFTRLLERRRPLDAIMLGVVLGLGLYTYPAVWALPIAMLVPLLFVRMEGGASSPPAEMRRRRCGAFQLGGIALVVGLTVAAPMLIYAATRPDYFFGRAQRTVEAAADAPLRDRLQRVLFMLHFRGDTNPRHNLPGAPMLDPITGAAVAFGVVVALRRLRADPARYGGLLAFWLVPLLPSALSDAAPHGLRAAAALPAVCTIAAVGVDRLLPVGRVGVALAAALLAAIGGWNARDYFVTWASDPRVASAHNADAMAFFRHAADLAAEHDVYVAATVFDAPQWRFLDLAPRSGWAPLAADALLAGDRGRDHVVISDRAAVNGVVESLYPDAEVVTRFASESGGPGRIYRIRRDRLRATLGPAERAALATALAEGAP